MSEKVSTALCAHTDNAILIGCTKRLTAFRTQYKNIGFYSKEPREQNLHVKTKNNSTWTKRVKIAIRQALAYLGIDQQDNGTLGEK